jgi:tellurite resistance protein TerC
MSELGLWVVFNAIVLALLVLDLALLHRQSREIRLREAAWWSVFWVAVSLLFNASLLWWYPLHQPELRAARALEFFTGYVIEKSLSVDNIFVFLVLFRYFGVEPRFQYRVLHWGILGALIMRGAMIAAGVALIQKFEWILYVFGAFLVWTGAKMMFHKPEDVDPEHNPVFRLARKYLPLTKNYEGQSFFVRQGGALLATPMFLVLLVVETTDVAFALDSIPAIFAVTRDPFIIYSSNVFAILGLRALYFLLAGIMPYFRYLGAGLSIVLMFIGGKMLIENWVHISTGVSLVIVGVVLSTAVIASVIARKAEAGPAAHTAPASTADPDRPDAAVFWKQIPQLIVMLGAPSENERGHAAAVLYAEGKALGDAATQAWRADSEFSGLLIGPPTVGIAVGQEHFDRIRTAWDSPPLADVPADLDAKEFELHTKGDSGGVQLDILTPRTADPNGALAKFLLKSGEGIQQVEYFVRDVDRATAVVRDRFGLQPVYPQTRAGANGTRVNFFLVSSPGGKRVLIELVEQR